MEEAYCLVCKKRCLGAPGKLGPATNQVMMQQLAIVRRAELAWERGGCMLLRFGASPQIASSVPHCSKAMMVWTEAGRNDSCTFLLRADRCDLAHEDLPRLPTPASAEPFAATTEIPVQPHCNWHHQRRNTHCGVEHHHERSNSLEAAWAVRYAIARLLHGACLIGVPPPVAPSCRRNSTDPNYR